MKDKGAYKITMKTKKKFICTILLSSFCCFATMTGCGTKEDPSVAKEQVDNNDTANETTNAANENNTESVNLGEFSIKDIEGNTYTQELFADYDITMINLFTTWCSPCVREIPDLEKLNNEMADQGVQVVGIVLDSVDQKGNVLDTVVEQAKLLAERTEAAYPFLIPDESNLNGRLMGIDAVPETFFVDKDGNIIGETYTGSRSLEDWKAIIETIQKEAGK